MSKGSGRSGAGTATTVSEVAHYQNDGTETIKAAKFVEKATRAKRGWASPVFRAVSKYLDGRMQPLKSVADMIARDIGAYCWRIDTGRLRESFKPYINSATSAAIKPGYPGSIP